MSDPGNAPPVLTSPAVANGVPPVSDQKKFDEVVDRDSRIVLGVLGGVALLAALIMSTVALVQSSNKAITTITQAVPAAATASAGASAPATAVPVFTSTIEGSSKKGPDGKMHDAFTKTEFAVKVGQEVKLTVTNKDNVSHSITSAEAGVNLVLLPGTHTYSMIVKQPGHFEWVCIIPCDSDANGWAMTHPGYMAGYITAT